ncbi:MAG: metallophosphoesterase family protein [Thermoplasmata archaeon]|nr:metallophosphoesterase family protein [Thermoplasmata archaeon]
MRILALTDIHGSQMGVNVLNHFMNKHKPDVLAISGDITHFGPTDWALRFLETAKIPILLVDGNCDPPDMVKAVLEHPDIDAHTSLEIEEITMVGILFPHEGMDLSGITGADVVVTHEPPFGYNDAAGGNHVGDRDILATIKRLEPKLVISGHIHEARGVVEADDRIYVNPGPARDGFAALIEYGDEVVVELLDLKSKPP